MRLYFRDDQDHFAVQDPATGLGILFGWREDLELPGEKNYRVFRRAADSGEGWCFATMYSGTAANLAELLPALSRGLAALAETASCNDVVAVLEDHGFSNGSKSYLIDLH